MKLARLIPAIAVGGFIVALAVGAGLIKTAPAGSVQAAGLGRTLRAARTSQLEYYGQSPALRDLQPDSPEPVQSWEHENPPLQMLGHKNVPDSVVQRTFGALGALAMPTPLAGWAGIGPTTSIPPDTNGDVGPNHYVQTVNVQYQIWNKNGTSLAGPTNLKAAWPNSTVCGSALGNPTDPIVLYDPLADRWLISFLAYRANMAQQRECIAISTSSDPTGTYNLYAFLMSTADLPDYPHLGVWPDGYYMSANWFTGGTTYAGPAVFVFQRTQMLQGLTANAQGFLLNTSFGPMLPADLDGPTQPPAGSPGYFLEFGSPMYVDRLQVDWNTPANTTFTSSAPFTPAGFTQLCASTQNCIAQPGTAQKLDGLGDRLMHRLAYRNFGTTFGATESLVVNHSVDVGGGQAGVRWYEIRDPNGTPTIYQQGTYAPDANSRWMGSAAMDHFGDIAVGYSASSSTLFPSIRYAGRLVTDTLGTLNQGEATLFAGTGYQTTYNRWGDYSDMTIDPVDDCTFWYTNEYNSSNGTAWRTRIAKFKFPSCVIQWSSTYTGTGAALAAPGLYFAGSTAQVFFGGNSGVEQAFSSTGTAGTALWARNAGAAIGDRGPIIPIGGTNYVAVTSQDGFVTLLNAATGALFWQRDLSGGGLAPRLLASPSYQAGVGPGNHGLVFVGTYYNAAPAANVFYALDATTGATVWTFTCTSGPCTGGLGLTTVTPAVDVTNNRVFFATKNVTAGGGGGLFALNSVTGAFLWARTDHGSANSGHPTLSDDLSTLYVALNNGLTLYAFTPATGADKPGWTAFSPGPGFTGAPWLDGSFLYASAGSAVYSRDAASGANNAAWPAGGATVPGAGSPITLSLVGDPSLYVSSTDGGFYRLNLADGSLSRRLALSPVAVSDPAYDFQHHVFYLTTNGILYTIQDRY